MMLGVSQTYQNLAKLICQLFRSQICCSQKTSFSNPFAVLSVTFWKGFQLCIFGPVMNNNLHFFSPFVFCGFKLSSNLSMLCFPSFSFLSTGLHLHGLGWPTIKQLVVKEAASLMYRFLNLLTLLYLLSIFTRCSDNSEQNLRSTDLNLKLPLLKKSRSEIFLLQRNHR